MVSDDGAPAPQRTGAMTHAQIVVPATRLRSLCELRRVAGTTE